MSSFRLIAAIAAVSAVSACSSGSSSPDADDFVIDAATNVPVSEIEDRFNASEEDLGEVFVERAQGLIGGIEGLANTPFTDPATVPTSGSAEYIGLLSLGPLTGEMTLTADLGDNSIGGSVDNIVIIGDLEADGSLEIGEFGSDIDRTAVLGTDSTFSASLTGELSTDITDVVVDAALFGNFTGTSREYIEGGTAGLIETEIDGIETLEIGVFVAER